MFKKIPLAALALLTAAVLVPGSALARMPSGEDAPQGLKDVAFGHDVAWAVSLEDDSLSEMRGGAGLMFSVFFSGELEFNQPGGAPEGLTVTPVTDNQVQISGALGSFGGASGVFQFTNVEGSMNVVNNNMVINVAIVNSPSVNLSTLFSGAR